MADVLREYSVDCALRGQCQLCDRKVGPATRGAKLRLDYETSRMLLAKYTRSRQDYEGSQFIKRGQAPTLAVWIDPEDPHGSVPEVLCDQGRNLFGGSSLFFLIKHERDPAPEFSSPWLALQDGREPGPALPLNAAVLLPAKGAEPGKLKPLTGSVSERVQLSSGLVGGGWAFDKLGSYSVWVAAGRLISNPVTVIVEEAKPAPVAPKAQEPPLPAPVPARPPAAPGEVF